MYNALRCKVFQSLISVQLKMKAHIITIYTFFNTNYTKGHYYVEINLDIRLGIYVPKTKKSDRGDSL